MKRYAIILGRELLHPILGLIILPSLLFIGFLIVNFNLNWEEAGIMTDSARDGVYFACMALNIWAIFEMMRAPIVKPHEVGDFERRVAGLSKIYGDKKSKLIIEIYSTWPFLFLFPASVGVYSSFNHVIAPSFDYIPGSGAEWVIMWGMALINGLVAVIYHKRWVRLSLESR